MLNGKTIGVVIPTLNEAEGIKRTLELVPEFVDEIVVVDGDSKDRTREIAAENGAKVVIEQRRGYGRAFKTGFESSTAEILATADGDGTYPIERLPELVEHLLSRNLEFVSCSRLPLEDRAAMKPVNFFGNYMMTKAAALLWLHPFADILSGMWVFRKSCLPRLELHSDSWNFSEEIKLQAYMRLGAGFGEYKIPYRERLGETKLMPWKVGVENLAYMLAMRTNSVSFFRGLLQRPASGAAKS